MFLQLGSGKNRKFININNVDYLEAWSKFEEDTNGLKNEIKVVTYSACSDRESYQVDDATFNHVRRYIDSMPDSGFIPIYVD